MRVSPLRVAATLILLLMGMTVIGSALADVRGWLNWRGPQQNGTSNEKNLPDKIDPKKPLWMNNYPGASTPVVADGKVYIMGYVGEGPDLQEGIACFDAETGKQLRTFKGHQGLVASVAFSPDG